MNETNFIESHTYFKSYQELYLAIQKYIEFNSIKIIIKKSSFISNNKILKFKMTENTINRLQYYYIQYRCEFGGNYISQSIIKNTFSKKINCPFLLVIKLIGSYLKVIKLVDHIKHDKSIF